jgi:DNA-binding SARP family transcriptional activator/tetratricopeptide (TPR) repeat protein
VAVEIRLLGAVQIIGDAGQQVGTGPAQQQLLVASLAADAGRPVAVDVLLDRIWGDVPAGARRTLPVLVTRLRRVLEQAGAARVVYRSGSYLLDTDPEQVDVHRMRALADRARNADLDPRARARLLRAAVGLWRGEPLTGLSAPWVERVRPAWSQQYVDTVVAWGNAELAGGDPGPVPALVAALVAEHPLNEPLIAVYLRALAAAGRGTDALAAYADTRARLADELGVDPGPELAALHQALLRGDPVRPAPAGDRPVPAQLPAGVPGFAGRQEQLARLDGLLGSQPGAVVISALLGTAGVGKTALALHWAHGVAGEFPDGQLYVNLRGFDPDGQVVAPADALHAMLDALGVPVGRIPAGADARAALYRSLLAGRRVLVVLDNARDAEQVRPLLPGTPTVLALVTSRDQLAGLIATNGARRLLVDLLDAEDSWQLLANRLDAGRLVAEPAAVAEIIDRCAGLPLALTVVAARADCDPGASLTTLAAELRDADRRLDALGLGDAATEVRTVFSWSYEALSEPAARMFRLVGLHPGPDLALPAAAALAGEPARDAAPMLAELTRVSLLTRSDGGRFSCHDLLREYAADLARRLDPGADRRAALGRLLDHYVSTAMAATGLLNPHRSPPAPPVDRTRFAGLLADRAEAAAWFAAEQANLIAAGRLAGSTGFDRQVCHLTWAITFLLDEHGRWRDLAALGASSLAAAARLGEPAARAYGHFVLSLADSRFGRYAAAEEHLRAALALYQELGDVERQAHTLGNLAFGQLQRGRAEAALGHARHALDLYRAAGNRPGEARAFNIVGWCRAQLGQLTGALADCAAALALAEDLGDTETLGRTLDSLGYIYHQLARYPQAVDSYRRAVALRHAQGARQEEADSLDRLGDTYLAAGDPAAARDAWQRALGALAELDHADAEAVRGKLAGLADAPIR